MFKPDLPCLPLIEERAKNILKEKIRKEYYPFDENTPQYIYNTYKYPDFDFNVFPQIWGSTTLGFTGIGGHKKHKHRRNHRKIFNDHIQFIKKLFPRQIIRTGNMKKHCPGSIDMGSLIR